MIKSMDMVRKSTAVAESIRGSGYRVRKMARVLCNGLMDKYILGTGVKVRYMDKVI